MKTLIRRLTTLALAVGVALGTSAGTDAQEDGFFRNSKRLGRAAFEYRDADIHAVVAYYYSQRNHDSRWLLVETAISTTRNLVFDRQDIAVVTPSGRRIALSSQARFVSDANKARLIVQNAAVTRHDVLSYFNERDRPEPMQLFALPGGTVLTNFAADRFRVAVGDLFFESPTGRWEPGTHSLVIERDGARAVMPIELE
jgi:hypothetical protein